MSTEAKIKVLVGVNHGIKSYSMLYLLQKQNYECLPVHFYSDRISQLPGFNQNFSYHGLHVEALKKQCQQLGLSLLVQEIKDDLIEFFINQSRLKLALNLQHDFHYDYTQILMQEFFRLREQMRVPFIAFGHMAKVRLYDDHAYLFSGTDPDVDQAYLFAECMPNDLTHILLPLGDLRLKDADKLFANLGIPAIEPTLNSQQLFLDKSLGHGYENLGKKLFQGSIVLEEDKKIKLGSHGGVHHYQVGQICEKNLTDFEYRNTDFVVTKKNYVTNELHVTNKAQGLGWNQMLCKLTMLKPDLNLNKPIDLFVSLPMGNEFYPVKVYPKIGSQLLLIAEDKIPFLEKNHLLLFTRGGSKQERILAAGRLLEGKWVSVSEKSTETYFF